LILIVLTAFIGAVLFVWTTSPLFAFQEAATAAKEHDLTKFQQRIDLTSFVDSLVDDLIVRPATETPGLTPLQRQVSAGAVALASSGMEREMIRGIEKSVGNSVRVHTIGFFGEAAIASGTNATSDFREVIKETGREVSGSVGRLKRIVYERMQLYAQTHRNSTPCRLLACPPAQRMAELNLILTEDGITLQGLKGISSYSIVGDGNGGNTSLVGIKFFSPRIARDVNVQVELVQQSTFGSWKIKRVSNVPQVFRQLGEDYDQEVHALIASSLSGISDAGVNNELHGATERIKASDAAQRLFKRFNIRL
jgi:hypothetical protein